MAESYDELISEIASYMHRDDLATVSPGFVQRAEARFNRMLLTPEREAVDTLTTVADTETVSLPSDFWALRALYIDADPKVILEAMSPDTLRGCYAAAASARPDGFFVQGGDTLVLGATPDAEYSLILNYWQTIPALNDANPTNWLLTSHPDIYLYGCLAEAAIYTFDEQRASYWRGICESHMQELMISSNRKNYGGAPLRARSPVIV